MATFGQAGSGLLVLIIFAGCVASEGLGTGDSEPQAKGEQLSPDALRITGIVTDVELRPLQNVSILAIPGELTATTDEAGAFLIGPVELGQYQIIAQGAGFKEKSGMVEVTHDSPNKIWITLTDPIGGEPYHETQIYVTHTYCTTSNAPCAPINTVLSQNITPDRPDLQWSVPNSGLANMRYEVWWEASLLAGDKRFTTRNPEGLFLGCDAVNNAATPTVLYFAGEGGPGFGMWVEPGIENEGGCEIFDPTPGKNYYTVNRPQDDNSTFDGLGIALVIDQRISNYLTFFYHLRGPDDFTAVPDQ